MAHMLHVDIFTALDLQERKLAILYNEAKRQRALDTIVIAHGFGGAKNVSDAMRVHGPYTEGFYKREREKLKITAQGF